MTVNYPLLHYQVNALTENLMHSHNVSYLWALQTVTQSDTYKSLIEKPWLQEEGDLFIYEMLEKELTNKNTL